MSAWENTYDTPDICDRCGVAGCGLDCTVRPREEATTEARETASPRPPQTACPHGTPWAVYCPDCEERPRGGSYYDHDRYAS